MGPRTRHSIVLVLASVLLLPLGAAAQAGTTDWRDAITRLRNQLHARPGHAQTRQQLAIAYNNYGIELGSEGKWDLAMSQLQEAVQLVPDHQQFRHNLANLYVNRAQEVSSANQSREALKLLTRALDYNPELSEAYVLRGQIQYSQQQLKAAKVAWERAVELDPSRSDVIEQLLQVTEELPIESKFDRISQAYFDLRFQDELSRSSGFDIRNVLQRARRQVGSDFAYWPRHKLVVLIYSDDQFRTLRQQAPEWVGGQYDGKIRVPLPGSEFDVKQVSTILFHEYTHAVVQDLSKGRCPVWFNEGLAEYEGWRHGQPQLDSLAEAHRQERLLSWDALDASFSTARTVKEVALGYQQAHSIVAYLIDRYGFWRVRRVLAGLAEGRAFDEIITKEFHITPDRLRRNWREWLPKWIRSHS